MILLFVFYFLFHFLSFVGRFCGKNHVGGKKNQKNNTQVGIDALATNESRIEKEKHNKNKNDK